MKNFYKNYLNEFRKATQGYLSQKEKRGESLFEEIILEKFPNLEKKLDIQIHKAKRTPNDLNTKRPL